MIEIGGKVKTTKVLVEGIVQGVGFRPFVYRIATELELSGYVRNLGNVVEIIIQGSDDKIADFCDRYWNLMHGWRKINNNSKIEYYTFYYMLLTFFTQ